MIKSVFFILYNLISILYYFAYLFFCLFLAIFKQKPAPKLTKLFPSFFFKQKLKIDFWLHAVSAGELKIAADLCQLLKKDGKNFLITYTSQTAKTLSQKLFPPKNQTPPFIFLRETPLDFLPTLLLFLLRIKPRKFICIEHDVWPNTLWLLKKINCHRIIVNYSLKPRDCRYYQRLPFLFKWIYDFDLFLLQSKSESVFLKKISLLRPFHYLGNLKFTPLMKRDKINKVTKKKTNPNRKLSPTKDSLLIVLASSHRGEEKMILDTLNEICNRDHWPSDKKINLVIIPRHLERIPALIKEIKTNKSLLKNFAAPTVIQTIAELNKQQHIYVVNSMGESLNFYRLADLILIGDTFFPRQGGHNFIEALPYQAAVFYGEYQQNYGDISDKLEAQQAVVRLKIKQLPAQLSFYLTHRRECQKINQKGKQIWQKLTYDEVQLRKMLIF